MCAPSSSASTTCNSSSISTTEWEDELSRVQIIPTAGSPEQREVDISNISHEDLQALREKDAFLYYSIPSVRRDELGFSDSSRSSRALDSPAAAAEEASASTTVKRCTRVSFECHTDLLMEDYLSEDLDFDEEELARIDHQLSRLFGLGSGQ